LTNSVARRLAAKSAVLNICVSGNERDPRDIVRRPVSAVEKNMRRIPKTSVMLKPRGCVNGVRRIARETPRIGEKGVRKIPRKLVNISAITTRRIVRGYLSVVENIARRIPSRERLAVLPDGEKQ
jgi:hypothetical protein